MTGFCAERQIIHVDMDAFFASVEQLDDTGLAGRPVLVGGAGRRGVVAAASYEARPFGVGSAMPMVEAMRRCPEAVIVPPRMGRYQEVSRQVFAIFRRYTPLVQGLSVDEAFLDVTGSRALFGDGAQIARRIKDTIRQEVGLTASAGVAPNKFLAKIASDLHKPDGLVIVCAADREAFLAPLAIERMWGVGPSAAGRLRALGIETIGDLAGQPLARLTYLLGSWGRDVHQLARGLDERPVVVDEPARSVGAEETFEGDLHGVRELERRLLSQSRRVARRLFGAGLSGRTVTVKVKYADFVLKTRRLVLPEPVSDTDSIYEAARALLRRFPRDGRGVRLTGVSVSGLVAGSSQQLLFPDARDERRKRLQRAVSEIEGRFGSAQVTRASLLED